MIGGMSSGSTGVIVWRWRQGPGSLALESRPRAQFAEATPLSLRHGDMRASSGGLLRRARLACVQSRSRQKMSPPQQAAVRSIVESAALDLEALVAISSPSGDIEGAERAVEICLARMPPGAVAERVRCSSPDHAPDLVLTLAGKGSGRLLLLGHLDTVVAHDAHISLKREGDTWRGSGAVDMKGGVALSLALANWLAERDELFAELAILLVMDEEWRLRPFAHVERFAHYDACLCFEAGEHAGEAEGVVVRRKAAGTIQVTARGRAAHAGSNPDAGINALLALAKAATDAAGLHDPHGARALSVVPSRIESGQAINVVPSIGELMIDVRAAGSASFDDVIEVVSRSSDGAQMDVELVRSWPGMDSRAASAGLLAAASRRLGRQIVGVSRGGASDASHLASVIPLTIDGLGPRGGHAHSPEEFVHRPSLDERAEVAMAICEELLGAPAK
jgi:glutamate carboxypeptidase